MKLSFARNAGHRVFDCLWEEEHLTRSEAYAWLAEQMGLPIAECHFSKFDVGMCEAAEWLSYHKLKHLRADRRNRMANPQFA